MENTANTSYQNSSAVFKILFWLCIPAFIFVLFHQVMMLLDFYPQTWVREIHFNLQNGIPFFLFLTGSFIRNKTLRIPMILFFSVFFLGYVLNSLDSWSIIHIRGLKWLIGPALLGLLITYILHFITKKEKRILDFLKISWFICIGYTQLSVVFPIISFKMFFFYETSGYLFIALMACGLYKFIRST